MIKEKGTYAGINYSKSTIDAINQYIADNGIPNPIKEKSIHTTLLYSRKYCPNYVPHGKTEPTIIGYPTGFEVFESSENTKRCLVMKLASTYLSIRHANLMFQHSATYDHPSYVPHITLSYDIGPLDISTLPPFVGPIEMVEEYGMDLDLDWNND